MFKYALKLNIRQLSRHKALMGIQVAGLVVGFTTLLLATYYLSYETGFDKFHKEGDRLYRLLLVEEGDGAVVTSPNLYPALETVLEEEYPQLESVVKVMYSPGGGGILTSFANDERQVLRDDINAISLAPDFFDIFSLPIRQGDISRLSEPFTAMISSTLAQEIYGHTDVVGKEFTEDDGHSYQIVGVFDPWEQQSHFAFELIKSYESIGARHGVDFHQNSWSWARMKFYIKLAAGVKEEKVSEALKTALSKFNPITSVGDSQYIQIQNVKDIYLYSDFNNNGWLQKANSRLLAVAVVAVIILIVSWVNAINISVALALEKIRAQGIQKTLGLSSTQLFLQRAIGHLFIHTIAVLMALTCFQLLKPWLNELAQIPSSFRFDFSTLSLLLLLWIVGLLMITLSSSMLVSRVSIGNALKDKLSQQVTSAGLVSKGLGTFQLIISLSFLLAVSVVWKQTRHLELTDRGIATENILVVKGPRAFDYESFSERPDVIKAEWMNIPGVLKVASSYAIPGSHISTYGIRPVGQPEHSNLPIAEHQVDHNFLSLYGHELLAGRFFSKDYPADDHGVVLTASATRLLFPELPFETVLGRKITSPEEEYQRTIIGIVADYHQLGPGEPYLPTAFVLDSESRGFYSIAYQTQDLSILEASIKSRFNELFKGNVYHSFYLSDYYDQLFARETQAIELLGLLTVVALILSVSGICSVLLLSLQHRLKELSIRKVLGASRTQLYAVVSKTHFWQLVLAVLLIVPVTYWYLSQWLNQYAVRIDISWLDILRPIVFTACLLLLAIYFTISKTLSANPSEVLNKE
jgi:putative ABC transport system permease protein